MQTPAQKVAVWALYDYAGAFAATVFGYYFSQWLVVDHHVSDLKFNLIFVLSSLLLLLSAPLLGIIADQVRVKLPALRIVTACSFIVLAAVALLAQFAAPTALVVNGVIVLLIAGQYFYQLSYVYYNPLLKELGDETQQARISGLGEASAVIGQLSGLIFTLPLATGVIYLVGHHDESQVFLPSAVVFLVLALPMMFFFQEKATRAKRVRIHVGQEIKGIMRHFWSLQQYPGVLRFLLAFFFFNDAILTAGHNFPIYVQRVFHLQAGTSAIVLACILFASALGAASSGYLARRLGEKRLLLLYLASWVVMLPITAYQTELPEFTVCMICIGLLLGGTAALARAVITYLTPQAEVSHVFGYYTMTARLASFLGPLSWGLITHGLRHEGILRYQVALATMAVFVLIGFLVIRKIPDDPMSLAAA